MSRRTASLAAVAAASLALPTGLAGASGSPVTRTVRIHDSFLSPAKLTVDRGSTVTFRWPSTPGDSHDVALKSGPKGVEKWRSQIATSHYAYKRRFRVPGRYVVACTLHPMMTTVITVRH